MVVVLELETDVQLRALKVIVGTAHGRGSVPTFEGSVIFM